MGSLTLNLDPAKQYALSVYCYIYRYGGLTGERNRSEIALSEAEKECGTARRVIASFTNDRPPSFNKEVEDNLRLICDSEDSMDEITQLILGASSALKAGEPTCFKTTSNDSTYNEVIISTQEFLELLTHYSTVRTLPDLGYKAKDIMELARSIDSINERVKKKPIKKSQTQARLLTDEKLLQAALDGFANLDNATELVEFNDAINSAKKIISTIVKKAKVEKAKKILIDTLIEYVTLGDRNNAEGWFKLIPFDYFFETKQQQLAEIISSHIYSIITTIPNFESSRVIAEECIASLEENIADYMVIAPMRDFYESLIQGYEKVHHE